MKKQMTGYPSIDKPWLKYYSEEAITKDIPEAKIYDYISSCCNGHEKNLCLEYFGKKITYCDFYREIEKVAKAFMALGVWGGEIVSIVAPTTPESIYCVYALNRLGAVANLIDPRLSAENIKEKIECSKFIVALDMIHEKIDVAIDENQKIVGFDIDVATEVCKRLGYELELKPISWTAKEMELNTKSIDCIWNGLSRSPEREEAMLLSDSYMKNNQVAVVLASSDMTKLADLAGKKVVVQSGSTANDAVEADADFKNSLGELISVSDNVQAMLDLETKGSDAVVMDEVVARYYMEKEGNKGKFKLLEGVLAEEEYAIAFRKGDTELCKAVNDTLKAMAADGKLAEIAKKWFGEDITIIGK